MKFKNITRFALLMAAVSSAAALAQTPAAAPGPATKPSGAQVNIHIKQALPEDVFNELSKQSGIKFSTNGDIWSQEDMQNPIDIDFSDRNFWSATMEACGFWGLQLQADWGNGGGHRVMLNRGGQNGATLPTCESQGFLVQAVSFTRQQTVQYSQPDQPNDSANLQMMVYVDPLIHVASFNQTVTVESATDDAGNSLALGKENGRMYGGMNSQRSMIYNCNAMMKYPAHPGKKISHLKGTLQVRGSTKVETFVVEHPLDAQDTGKTIGDLEISFESMKKIQNNMYEVKIAISTTDEERGGNLYPVLQSAQLTDEKGRAYSYNGGGGGGGGNGSYEYTLNYSTNGRSKSGDPARWTLELPTDVKTFRIPVEFSDLPLP